MNKTPFQSIKDSVWDEWHKTDNSLIKLLIAFAFSYVLLLLVRLGLSIFLDNVSALHYHNLIIQKLTLSADFRVMFMEQPWAFLTFMFVYQSFIDILFGLLVLYSAGRLFMYVFGEGKLMAFAMLSALMSALAYLLVAGILPFFQVAYSPSFGGGATGLSFALLTASATIRPNEPIRLFIFGPFKLKYVVWFLVGITFLGVFGNHVPGHLSAVLGCSLLGWIYAMQYRAGYDWAAPFNKILNFLGNLFGRKSKVYKFKNQGQRGKTDSQGQSSKAGSSYNNKSEREIIDAILDKINESGYDSLSSEEKQLLFKASKKGKP
ncbi:MAG: rhomboid family intramembrane serine protease [Cytophagales bacterium]|nr:MAG: rhomboid family intramembrane serine protease [Cytophagales bacterium]TAF61469.1 MAG: rhomboid family intramembrane serine protease [Cytophagales bacterium]